MCFLKHFLWNYNGRHFCFHLSMMFAYDEYQAIILIRFVSLWCWSGDWMYKICIYIYHYPPSPPPPPLPHSAFYASLSLAVILHCSFFICKEANVRRCFKSRESLLTRCCQTITSVAVWRKSLAHPAINPDFLSYNSGRRKRISSVNARRTLWNRCTLV